MAVLRQAAAPPQGQLLPKAHEMSRAWALISALAATPVPVPEAMAFSDSQDVTGAWFYVMGRVDAKPLYTDTATRARVPLQRREALAYFFFDVLARRHAQDRRR